MSKRNLQFAVIALVLSLSMIAANVAMAQSVTDAVYGDPGTPPGTIPGSGGTTGTTKPLAQIQLELEQAGINDVKAEDWFAGPVTVLVQAGLMPPSPEGNWNPMGELSNFDAISVFAKVLGIAAKDDTPDVALSKMKSAGLVSDTTVGETLMTRMEVARMLALALGIEPKVVADPANFPFTDFEAFGGNTNDLGILAALHEQGVFKGFEDGTFRPGATLTRAQLAVLADRILGTT